MEVPFDYLCFLALERLLKYENIRHIKIETLSKYIECIKNEFMISFNSGEPAYNEKGIKRNFKFESFDLNQKINDLLNNYEDIIYLGNDNNIVLEDNIDCEMLEGILDEFNVSSRFKLVFFDGDNRKILNINTILNVLKEYNLFEKKLEETYLNLPFRTDKKKTISELKSFMIFRELFLYKLKSLSETKLECYYDESNEFVNLSQDEYDDYPINKAFWYKSMYYDGRVPDEIDDILYDMYLYSMFSDGNISSLKINNEIYKIYLNALDYSEDNDYFFQEYLDEIPDIDSDNFMYDSDYEIEITDEELDYLFYLTFVRKIDKFMSENGMSTELIFKRQRLLYSLDTSDYCLYNENNIDSLLDELKGRVENVRLPKYEIFMYFLTEEIFKEPTNNNTITKLLLISSYYDITKDEKIKMLFNKNSNNRYYDLFEKIIFNNEKTLSL